MAGQADPIDRGREVLLRALREGDVRFVVIGGAALQSHGQRYETEDIDITPDRAEQNEQRRVAATTITVEIASLADVEHSKRTADRAKDRAYLQQVGRLGPPQPTAETPSIVHDLLRAYARREELRAARAEIADPQTTRRDRARALAYDLGLKAIEEEIAGLEQSNGGPLTAQQHSELEHPHSSP